MRNPVACVSCRSAKQKCIHQDAPPCDRCKASGRAHLCEFPPPGTSAIHRRPKRPRQDSGSTPPSNPPSATPTQSAVRAYRSDAPNGISPTNAATSPTVAASLLDGLDPFELLTDEVKNSYLRCSYKWSFHHTPTLLLRIRDRTLEVWMVWAILALAIRCVPARLPLHPSSPPLQPTANPSTASSRNPHRPSAPRPRPATPSLPMPARSCSRTSRPPASRASRPC